MTRRWDTSDRGASLLFVLTIVMVLSVASLGVAKIGFATSKSDEVLSLEQRYANALDIAAAAGLDSVRGAGNRCPAENWKQPVDDVDGLADAAAGVPAIKVELACTASGDQVLLTATRMMECPGGTVAPTSQLTLTLRAADVGADTLSLQLLRRSVTDVPTGCPLP
ncbi:MAG: hypothetical protein ACT4QG_01500 [Sporichthyaceae bacterium]